MRISGSSSIERSSHQPSEQRVRAIWAALELRMALRPEPERIGGQLDELDESIVRRSSAQNESTIFEALAEAVVHFVAMAMSLRDRRLAVELSDLRSCFQQRHIRAEPHRA